MIGLDCILKILRRKGKDREEEPAEKPQQEPIFTPLRNIDDLTNKIIFTVLDHLDSMSSATAVHKRGKKKRRRRRNAQLLSDELRTKAARTVSQLLFISSEVWEVISSSSSFPSSLCSEPDLDSMIEAMAQSGFPTDLMRRLLDSTAHNIIETIEGNKKVSSYSTFIVERMTKRIKMKVKSFLTVTKTLVKERETELEQDADPPSASHTSQMDDPTIRCTCDIIDGIIQVCHPHGGGETTEQGVQKVMQELQIIICSSESSDLVVNDLEESKGSSHVHQHHESLLSDAFHQKVKRAICDALLKTTRVVSPQSMDDIVVVDLEMCDEQFDTSLEYSPLIESAASDMADTIIEDLKKVSSQQVDDGSSSFRSRETFRSAACRLHRNVHFKVCGYLSRLRESRSCSVSNKDESTKGEDQESKSAVPISPPPHFIPGIQHQQGFCMEVCDEEVELCKSELLLASSSYGRAFSSPAETKSAADQQTAAVTMPVSEAVEINLASRNTSLESLNSIRQTLSQHGHVSSPPEGPCRSKRLTVFRRVKHFLTHLFTGARSTSHVPTSTTDDEDFTEEHFPEVLIDDLQFHMDPKDTLTNRTRDYLTLDSESPGLAPTASNRADNYSTEDCETFSCSSIQVYKNVPVDPDPATVKKRGLTIRKRLTRIFCARRRALPNPFQHMRGSNVYNCGVPEGDTYRNASCSSVQSEFDVKL